MNSNFTALTNAFPNETFIAEYLLAPRTYAKIGGPAEVFFSTNNKQTLTQVVAFCHQTAIPVTILGGGSNVIVADQGIQGLVCSFTGAAVTTQETTSEHTIIHVESGCKTALLVSQTVALGLTGLEYFLGVPGTVGGAVYNNAHYLNDLIGEHIVQVEIISSTGELTWITQEECAFAYDYSRFHQTKEYIVTVAFALKPGELVDSRAKIRQATQYRAQTQPLGIPSSGCMFKNTPNTEKLKQLFPQFADKPFVPTGFLIDQAGLKGTRVGGIEVSQKHAAWLINTDKGSAQDIKELVAKIKTTIQAAYGVELQEEIVYLT